MRHDQPSLEPAVRRGTRPRNGCNLVGGESDLARPHSPCARAASVCLWLVFGSGFYVPTGAVWASIVRSSAPAVIGTLRGLAASATGMRSVSTPVS
jgi:hypothetical protein